MRGEAFLGTDFNYEDLGFQYMEFQQHKLESYDEKARDCYRVASIPQEGWWYSRIVRCIDKKTFLPLRTEYYNRTGTLWKVRTLDGVKTIKSFPTASRITMQTVATGTQTSITLSEIQYDAGLPDALFEGGR
jgi:outer membrane lipoprotein-sorting protein